MSLMTALRSRDGPGSCRRSCGNAADSAERQLTVGDLCLTASPGRTARDLGAGADVVILRLTCHGRGEDQHPGALGFCLRAQQRIWGLSFERTSLLCEPRKGPRDLALNSSRRDYSGVCVSPGVGE